MSANQHVRRWGSILAVRIPEAIAEQWGVTDGSAIELDVEGERVAMRKRNYDLDDLLARVTPDNRHPEQDTREPQGNEEW